MDEDSAEPQVLDALKVVLGAFDIETTPYNVAHFSVLMEALKLYDQRTQAYGQAWEQYGAMSNLLKVASKTDRMMAVWWTGEDEIGLPHDEGFHKDSLDDALDGINYTAFFIRNARRRNIYGSQPTRPQIPQMLRRTIEGTFTITCLHHTPLYLPCEACMNEATQPMRGEGP